jgi:hypothetical protein
LRVDQRVFELESKVASSALCGHGAGKSEVGEHEVPNHLAGGVAGAARKTVGIQTADGLELPMGVFVRTGAG